MTFSLDRQPDGSVRLSLIVQDASREHAETLLHLFAALDEEQQRQVRILFEGDVRAAEAVADAYGITRA
jgi:hypothetical protein